MDAAIGPSTTLRISSLHSLLHGEQNTSSQSPQTPASIVDSSDGNALMGILRVADRTEKFTFAPFRIPAGSLVFCETSIGKTEQVRCLAAAPRVSWFLDDITVLLTHWRYIQPPNILRGDSAKAWSYIEILSAPVLLPATIELPHIERPLSWWLKHQVFPELELEQDLFATIRESPPIDGTKASLILAQHPRKRQKSERSATTGTKLTRIGDESLAPLSIIGRVRAVGALSPDVDCGDPGFLVEMAMDPAQSDDDTLVLVPILLCGQRFLGLFASVCVDESLLITDLHPATLSISESNKQTVFTTSPESKAFRIDEFDGLEESQIYVSAASQTPFTQQSQQSLLSQIMYHSATAHTRTHLSDTCVQTPAQAPAAGDLNLTVHDGKLESYAGEVTRVIDAMLGIFVIDDSHLLMLTFWPLLSPVFALRPGSRILLDNMHVLLLSDSDSYHWNWLKLAFPNSSGTRPSEERRVLVFGACARSSIRAVDFPDSKDPAGLPAVVDAGLVPVIIKRVCGLVQMIETIEAFWLLRKKFPAGPLAAESRKSESKEYATQQLMQMALALSGSCGELAGSAAFRPGTLLEFANHQLLCRSGRTLISGPRRVITLREVVRRFAGWRKQRNERASNALDRRTEEGPLTNIYPPELQLEGIPLIGRLAVNERGCVYLRDETAELRVCVGAAIRDPHLASQVSRPAFSGQNLVGHVCIWRSWHFVVENIVVAPGSTCDGHSKQFSQVYAQISNPTTLHVDKAFGGVADGSVDTSASGFLFVAHSQGPAMPRLVSTNGATLWEAVSTVKGVRFRISSNSMLKQLHAESASSDIAVLDINEAFQAVSILCRPGKTPVCFASGSAYIICTQSTSNYRKLSAASDPGFALCELGPLDHVHPVRLVLGDSRLTDDCQADAGIFDIAREIPAVQINAASDCIYKQLIPTVYSVCDLFDSAAAEPEPRKSSTAKSAGFTEGIISVGGIISQCETRSLVELATSNKRQGSEGGTESIVGQLEKQITLQDVDDSTKTIVLYMKMTSYSHSLGMVPGARVVCRDVVLNISKSSGNPYLNGTLATSIDVADADPVPSNSGLQDTESSVLSEPANMCIGALYTAQQACTVELGCQVRSVESLKVSMVCISCKQVVCNMGCGCVKKQHQISVSSRSTRPATTRVEAELLCLVSDGSGIAWAAVSNSADLACVLGLSSSELEGLYRKAAQSWNGQLLWRAPRRGWAQPQAQNSPGVVDRAAATAVGASILVEGAVQRGSRAVKRQQLRLDGDDVVVDKLLAPRIAALQVTRPVATELCWRLLDDLDKV